ncbi:MAG: hypothetical protein QOI61_266 [Actinomycetota bacterium]|jgi:hypothetical protein
MQLLPKKAAIALVALCALGSTACVKQDDPGVGLVKFDSSAVFGITPKEKAVVPDFALPEEAFDLPVEVPKRIIDPKLDGPCPAAKLTAFPKASASVLVKDKPVEGVYRWKKNLLQIKDATKTPPIMINQPFALQNRAIRRVTNEGTHQFSYQMLAPDPFIGGDTVITTFRVNTNPELLVDRTVAARTIGVTNIPGTDVRVANPSDAPGIFITGVEVQDGSGARVSSFSPVQPMLVVPLEGGIVRSGQTFQSVGIDATTGTAIRNDGIVGRTSRVDACGEIVEGYSITLHQVLTSDVPVDDPIGSAARLGTRQETREIAYTFATQYGALPIAETLSLGDINVDELAALGKWELGGLTPIALPDSLK